MRDVLINKRWELSLPDHRDLGEWWDTWEAERLASMHDELEEGDLVYYVGAEQGDMPALISSWGCDLVLVEPVARVWPNMRAAWEANDLTPPVASFCGFAGDDLKRCSQSDVWSHWPPEAGGDVTDVEGFAHLWERDDLPVISLDALHDFIVIAQSKRVVPDAISIDVEGSELEVLKGAEGILLLHRPIVWVSIHPDFMRDLYWSSPVEVHALMEDLGYTGELLADTHEQHWVFRP